MIESTEEVVENVWRAGNHPRRYNSISKLLHRTKIELWKWNKQSVGNLFTKVVDKTEDAIKVLQVKEGRDGVLSDRILCLLRRLSNEYNTTLRHHEILWRHKSTV